MVLTRDDGPIDLKLLGEMLSDQLVELGYLSLRPGETPFSPGEPARVLGEAVERFAELAVLDEGYEARLRRALTYVLNLGDAELDVAAARMRIAFPSPDVALRRRFLELLWVRTFADWRVAGFDASAYEERWK